MRRIVLRLAVPILAALIVAAAAQAQDAASPRFTPYVGAGVFAAQDHAKGELQAGASFELAPPDAGAGFSFEGGYVGPWSDFKTGSALVSVDYMTYWAVGAGGSGKTPSGHPYWHDRGWKIFPFASAGYTRLFGTGNAANFGGGFDYRLNKHHAIRFELRDYYAPAAPSQHNIGFRIGWVSYVPD